MAKHKILLVEDHPDHQRVVGSILRNRMECDVVIAPDGEQAVRLAETEKPDLTVLDIQLPVLDGFEVLEQLKKRAIPTRVIMLSGFRVDIETAVKAIKAGACDYLTKPVDAVRLIDSVKRALLTESTINLRLPSEMPGLLQQLMQMKTGSDASEQGFDAKIKQHWLPVMGGFGLLVAGVTWTIAANVAIGPRDFEIDRQKAIIEQQTADIQRLSASPPPQLSPTAAPTPTTAP